MFARHKNGLGLGFDVGYTYRSQHPQDLPYGDAVTIQPWISYAATANLTLRAEVLAEKQIDAAISGADFPVEIVPGLDYRIGTVDLFVGAGFGMTDGIGSPAYRIIGGLRYRHFSSGPADIGERRGDRIVERGSGPDPDGDGIRGSADRCPDEAEDYDGFQDSDGCPEADNDKDGVPDDEDECPELPGPSSHHGCPAKTYVKVVKGRLFVFGKVQFASNSAQIEPHSEAVLDQVATELRAHPGIKVRIDGHTDNVGGAGYNKKLAGERAVAVEVALERRGVARKRLSTRGVGEERPIAPNRTPAGRAKNRRVEFIIVGGK